MLVTVLLLVLGLAILSPLCATAMRHVLYLALPEGAGWGKLLWKLCTVHRGYWDSGRWRRSRRGRERAAIRDMPWTSGDSATGPRRQKTLLKN